jgi:hypothetical protein
MIIVRLVGGLGNQLFQYAAGRRLALRHGVPLRLDLRALETDVKRQYALGPFAVDATTASAADLADVPPVEAGLVERGYRRLRRAVRPPGRVPAVFLEPEAGRVDARVLKAPAHSYLCGFWQSETYFSEAADQVRDDLRLRQPLDEPNARIAKRIRGGTSASLHVRRTDYVADARTHATHGTCSLDYYERAISLIDERLGDPTYFVFSDDPAWARDNLSSSRTVFVDHNLGSPRGDAHDLTLMAMCDAHVIANSSFSWWGAWLSRSSGPVVAPARWFARADLDARDLLPSQWIRL